MTDGIRLAVEEVRCQVLNLYTRFPFQYGIASLESLPHIVVDLRLTSGGSKSKGRAAEHLPPKWFTKDPETSFEDDLGDFLRVIRRAIAIAEGLGDQERSFFSFWQALTREQSDWARECGVAPLLASLGVSLVERAVLDALCRHHVQPLGVLLREQALGIELGEVRSDLEGVTLPEVLPERPLTRVAVRHTVGLGDPLAEDEIAPEARLHDGLPHALTECVDVYGCRYFKIKLSGHRERDQERLRRLGRLLHERLGEAFSITVDGNENYHCVDSFAADWEAYLGDSQMEGLMKRLLFVEQPFHRSVALEAPVLKRLSEWNERPRMIIDESDGDLEALPKALGMGYAGTSHKNCKGIVKGLVNAATLWKRRRDDPNGHWILSGEDLANVGPWAMMQDLCLMAQLGITHVERNGHHYFKGLDAFPQGVQAEVVRHHPDLYERHPEKGFPRLRIENGQVSATSVVAAPFGLEPWIEDLSGFTPLDQWDPASLAQGG